MHFRGIVALLLCRLPWVLPHPVDAIIVQIQQWGVIGAEQFGERVLLNGVSFGRSNHEINNLIKNMSAGALLPASIGISQISALNDHTILRSRECILEGLQLHWSDRVFYDGKAYLTLEHNDTWTVHVPQAVALKVLWDQDMARTRTERMHLQEGCIQLMKELRLSDQQSVSEIPLPQQLIPILGVVAFLGLIVVSLIVYKKQGLKHPGGVIGSVIHYPKDMTDVDAEIIARGYRTL